MAARQLPGSRRRSGARRPICTWWSIPAAAAHRPRGMGSVFVTNSRATRRAGELAAADPAHRARLGRRLELDARSRPEISPCGAPFGHELERTLVCGNLVSCVGPSPMGRVTAATCDAPRKPGKSPLYLSPRVRHPPFGHHTVSPPRLLLLFSLGRLGPRSGPPPANEPNEPPNNRSGGSPALTATWRPRVQVLLSDLLYVALARRLVVRGGGEDLPLESLPLLGGGRVELQHRLGEGRVKGHLVRVRVRVRARVRVRVRLRVRLRVRVS